MSSARTIFCVPLSAPGSLTTRASRRPSTSPPAVTFFARAQRRGLPGPGQLDGVGPQRHRITRVGEDQAGHPQRRRGLFGGRLGDRREQRGGGLDPAGHARRGEHGGRTAETVTDDAQLGGVHADLAGSQPHAGDDVERRAQVEGQVQHRRRDAGLGVRGRGDDAPRRQVLQRARVPVGARPASRDRTPRRAGSSPTRGCRRRPGKPAKARSPRRTRCGPRRVNAAKSFFVLATR